MSDLARAHANGAAPALPAAPDQTELVSLFAFSATRPDDNRLSPAAEFETRLTLLRVGPVTALAGMVPASEYRGEAGDLNMADIAWLTPRIRRHAAMIDWLMQDATVFPAPFGTLYVSLDSLSNFIRVHEKAITRFLREVTGKQEWELRAFARLDGPETLNRMAKLQDPDWDGLTPGKRYMRLSRDKPALIEAGRRATDTLVDALAAELAVMTAASRRLASGVRSDETGADLIARHAFLVDAKDAVRVTSLIEEARLELIRYGVTLTLSGPWPPFSFRPYLHKVPDPAGE